MSVLKEKEPGSFNSVENLVPTAMLIRIEVRNAAFMLLERDNYVVETSDALARNVSRVEKLFR